MHYCTSFKEQDKIEHFRCCLRLRKKFSRIYFAVIWFILFLVAIAFFLLSPTTKWFSKEFAILDESVTFSYKPQTKKGERNLPKKDQTIGEIIEAKNGIYFVGSDIELVDVGPVLFVDKNDVPAEDYSKLREMLKSVFLEKYYDYSAE